jgi:mannan endo-1,4-beta-mannosidase
MSQPLLIDEDATKQTKNLYEFLSSIDNTETLFGHQDDLLYGIGWNDNLKDSDVQRLSGDLPVVYGWDVGSLGNEHNLDSVAFKSILKGIKKVYKSGGINTISWHMENPVTGGSSWDITSNISEILPGGTRHEVFIAKLDLFAELIDKCKVGFGKRIPIVFRPYHEHNGDWFWWGKKQTDEADYIALWRFTVDYLRDEKQIHNLIYAFSPDRSRLNLKDGWQEYHYGYPGDDYVDIIGLDNYWDLGHKQNNRTSAQQYEDYLQSIQLISKIAADKGKVAALTETGNSTVSIDNWYTERLLTPLKHKDTKIAWALVWRNANMEHYYVPIKGHKNEQDFIKFVENKSTLFLSDITNPYKQK